MTEDFGGYDLGDDQDASGLSRPLGYDRVEDSVGISKSAIKQTAALNIKEAATPIHVSQNSI